MSIEYFSIYVCLLSLPSSVDYVVSELSTMTWLSWVALHGMAHSFIELDKAVVHVIRLEIILRGDSPRPPPPR